MSSFRFGDLFTMGQSVSADLENAAYRWAQHLLTVDFSVSHAHLPALHADGTSARYSLLDRPLFLSRCREDAMHALSEGNHSTSRQDPALSESEATFPSMQR
ncbi:hypothetical protein [Ktedonobacter racemifer]|uniref:hypothetical protein n=1 Tax=Ktedonobacter racemifer TaxID=363277 RepID=UPI000590D5C1|nr:hypothetical protein [Ktedonobacter racemifer]